MSLDKLVDSTQLDSDLTSVANAIRAKSGGSSQLAFPAGFVSEIGNIPSGGGGWTSTGIAAGTEPSGAIEINDVAITNNAFTYKSAITSIHIKNASVKDIGQSAFAYCTSLTTLVGEKIDDSMSSIVQGANALTVIDYDVKRIYGYGFQSAPALATIILRKTDALTQLLGISAFNNTPFKSGGTGGTIYIPKAFYDHLGDGGSYDYKAASNWSTVNGYGTITWAKIEGSYYETHYADGTAIS